MEEFDVRAASEFVPAAALSGGINKKRLSLVRLIVILIYRQPANSWFWMSVPLNISKRLIEERDNGKAVLVVSFELMRF